MINLETAWPLIRENAIKAYKTNMKWHSLVHGNEYQLVSVFADHLVIHRADGANDQQLTMNRVVQAADDFNAQGCHVQRGQLINPTVAEETAFVLFHPQLTWDDQNEFIIEI